MNCNLYNGLCLAYIGDAIYEIYVRKHALAMGLTKVNDLHRMVTGYTSALAQASSMHAFLEGNILTEEELAIFKRGRNSHVNTKRKHVDLANYLDATGFEALLGYLYLIDNKESLEELIAISLKRD